MVVKFNYCITLSSEAHRANLVSHHILYILCIYPVILKATPYIHTKKRDCNVAVPLIEALVLPFVTNSNTIAHAVCILYAQNVYSNTHHEHLSVAMFCYCEFTRFQ